MVMMMMITAMTMMMTMMKMTMTTTTNFIQIIVPNREIFCMFAAVHVHRWQS
jgi:hypothetical protein